MPSPTPSSLPLPVTPDRPRPSPGHHPAVRHLRRHLRRRVSRPPPSGEWRKSLRGYPPTAARAAPPPRRYPPDQSRFLDPRTLENPGGAGAAPLKRRSAGGAASPQHNNCSGRSESPPASPGVHSRAPYNYIQIVCSSMGKIDRSLTGRFFRADNPVRCTG